MNLDGISPRRILALAGAATLMLVSSAPAQQMDMAAYNKWAPVVVVHYVVVGEYAGDTTQISDMASGGVRAKATVKDRVELTFDWDQSELNFVGTPVVKNFPTTINTLTPYAGCGTPRITGTYEHATYLNLTTQGTGHLNTDLKRDFVTAVVDQMGDTENSCGATSVNIPGKSETGATMLLILPPQYYAMPATATTRVSTDKKSIIVTDGTGWTWTYTMTPVR